MEDDYHNFSYPTKFVPTITVKYPIFVKNDEIPIMLIENSSLQNKICVELIETMEGHHSSGFKLIFVSFSAQKSIMVDLNAKVLVNLVSKTPFHSVFTIKSIPLNPRGDPPKPLGGATITSM
jgi:hypothetical protein